MDRLSPSPSPSSGSLDDDNMDGVPIERDIQWSRPPQEPSNPLTKRRTQAPVQVIPKSKRAEEKTRFTGNTRGPQESKKEELIDAELARTLKNAIGDPFDESILHSRS